MTVKELIEKLQKLPQDAETHIFDNGVGCGRVYIEFDKTENDVYFTTTPSQNSENMIY
jgi:hypothetical protein